MVFLSRNGGFAFLQKGSSCVFGSTSSSWSYLSKEQNYQFDNYPFHQNQLYLLLTKALTFVFLFFFNRKHFF